MKLLTTLPTPSPSATPSADSAFKPYTTASVKAKLSFPASTVPSLGFPSLLRRRSSAGAGDAEEIHFSSMEYVFVGKLSVQEVSPISTNGRERERCGISNIGSFEKLTLPFPFPHLSFLCLSVRNPSSSPSSLPLPLTLDTSETKLPPLPPLDDCLFRASSPVPS